MNVVDRKFTFEDHKKAEEVEIIIKEVLDPDYGMYVWPCAPVLAQYIWYHRDTVRGRHLLELGAGTSLPGIMAAKIGARVVLSDAAHLPHCLETCRRNCQANDVRDVLVTSITWGHFNPELLDLEPVDVIIGSDCFYDTKDFEDIIVTVAYILEKNRKAEFWTTYQERSADRSIAQLLQKWGLRCFCIPLENFDANYPSIGKSGLPGSAPLLDTLPSSGIDWWWKVRKWKWRKFAFPE